MNSNLINFDAPATLTIEGLTIRVDSHGRYCLNDLHAASGGEKANQPSNWLRNSKTQELISELDRSSNLRSALNVVNGGLDYGTYVCEDLVYAYAMWISPAFQLKVIRAYRAIAEKPRFTTPTTLHEALQLAADTERARVEAQALADKRKAHIAIYKENEASMLTEIDEHKETIQTQKEVIERQAPDVNFRRVYEENGEDLGFRELVKLIKSAGIPVTEPELRQYLVKNRFMHKLGGRYVPSAPYDQSAMGYFRATINSAGQREWKFTPKGGNAFLKLWEIEAKRAPLGGFAKAFARRA